MALRLNLQQFIYPIRFRRDAFDAIPHPMFGRVEKQVEGHFFILAADKLEKRRIQAWNRDLRYLDAFIERELRGVELNLDRIKIQQILLLVHCHDGRLLELLHM